MSNRRKRPGLTRRTRVLILVAAVAVIVVPAILLGRGSGSTGDADQQRVWKLHDDVRSAYQREQFADALRLSDELLVARPDDAIAHFNRGLALLRLEREDEAWAAIEGAASRNADLDEAQILLANRELAAGDEEAARNRLRRAVARDPTPAAVFSLLASLLRRPGEQGEVLDLLARVAHATEASTLPRVRAAVQIAQIRGVRAMTADAAATERAAEREYLALALSLAEDASDVADPAEARELDQLRAWALLSRGRNGEALAAVDRLLRDEVDAAVRARLHLLRAQIYWLEGDGVAAEREMGVVVDGDETPSVDVYIAVAAVYGGRGFVERARQILERAAGEHADDEAVGLAYAQALSRSGQADAAELECRRVADRQSESTAALLLLGDLRIVRGNLDGARAAYHAATERQPTDLAARLRLAAADVDPTGQSPKQLLARIEADARAALAGHEDSVAARVVLAKVLLARAAAPGSTIVRRREAGAAAAELLQTALDEDPRLFEARILLATAHAMQGRHEAAALGYERILDALPEESSRLRLSLARAYLGMGAVRRALQHAERALDGLPDDPGALRVFLQAARAAGDGDRALSALERLLLLEPGRIEHILAQGFILGTRGDMDAADACFDSADELAAAAEDPDERQTMLTRAASARAEVYRIAGDFEKARGVFGALIGRAGDAVDVRLRFGRFLQAAGQLEEAEAEFRRAISIDESATEPRRALCDLWFGQGEATPELIQQVEELRRIAAGDPVLDYVEGKLAVLQSDIPRARERLGMYVDAHPADANAHFALGSAHLAAGDFEAAIASYRRSAALVPGRVRIRAALARARFARAEQLIRRGRFDAARAVLAESGSALPGESRNRALFAQLSNAAGEGELAEAELRELLRINPDDGTARRMLAVMLVARGEAGEAIRELQVLTERHSGDWNAWRLLSAGYLELQRYVEAEQAARKAIEVDPDEAQTVAALIEVHLQTGEDPEARSLVDAFVAAHPQDALGWLMVAMLETRLERWSEVVPAARATLDLDPTLVMAVSLATHAMRVQMSDSDGALEFAKTSAAAAPESLDVHMILAFQHSQRGEHEQTIAVLEPFIERDEPYLVAVALAAISHLQESRTQQVRDLCARGLEFNPEHADLLYLIAQSHILDAQASGDASVQGARRGVVLSSLRNTVVAAPFHHRARNDLAFLLTTDAGALDEALNEATRAVGDRPQHPPYLDTLGTVHLRRKDLEDAVETFRRALGILDRVQDDLETRADTPLFRAEPARLKGLQERVERQMAEVREHLEEAEAELKSR